MHLILLPYQSIHELKCRVDDLRSFSCFYSSVSQFVVCSNTQWMRESMWSRSCGYVYNCIQYTLLLSFFTTFATSLQIDLSQDRGQVKISNIIPSIYSTLLLSNIFKFCETLLLHLHYYHHQIKINTLIQLLVSIFMLAIQLLSIKFDIFS